jgi:hypothetical protein
MAAAVDPNAGFLRDPFERLVKCGNGVKLHALKGGAFR